MMEETHEAAGERTAEWNNFMRSLDVGPEKALGIEQLPDDQKVHLLKSYTAVTSKCSAAHYVTLIKGLRTGRTTLTRTSKRDGMQSAKEILSATEISLRTNDISWVYDFLDKHGLEALQRYMCRTIRLLLSNKELLPRTDKPNSQSDVRVNGDGAVTLSDSTELQTNRFWCHGLRRRSRTTVKQRNGSTGLTQVSQDAVTEGLHQGVKCLRALLNNQRGCSMTFDNAESINVISLCLLHPSFQTKLLVLELLAAVCLIVGGHERVLRAFDQLRIELGEKTRFSTLVSYFCNHEKLPSEQYSNDFMVSCMQFINIIVHSTEDFNLRVFLQQEFTTLGLDRYLQRLEGKTRGRLTQQVDAYLDNKVDVAVLLEESQAKEQYQQEAESLELDILNLQNQLATMQVEYGAARRELEMQLAESQQIIATSEARLHSHESEMRTMKMRLTVSDQSSSSREQTLVSRIAELETKLKQDAELSSRNDRTTAVSVAEEASSSQPNSTVTNHDVPSGSTFDPLPPPPPPPPPPPTVPGAPPPPPPPPGMAMPPRGSQAVPIRQPFQTRYKLPLFNWAVLRNQQLRNTVFVGMNDEAVIERLDMQNFEELFKLSSNAIGGRLDTTDNATNGPDSGVRAPRKSEKKRLMDPNRHRCIGILLRYLESEKFTPDLLRLAISDLNVNVDVADRILHQQPTQDETKIYLSYEFTDKKPVDQLTDEDRLLLDLCKIQRLGLRLEIIVFMNSFDATLDSLMPKIAAVRSASRNLKNSDKLRQLLEIILALGNYMNSCRRGVVYGFRLQSLEQLSDTKTVDKQMTLLQFVVNSIEREFPKLLNFHEELVGVMLASKVPMETLTADVTAVMTGMSQAAQELSTEGINAPQRLVDFVTSKQRLVDSLQHQAKEALELYSQTVEWFGESQNKPSPERFFSYIIKFVEQFQKAQLENEKRRRAEAARLKSAGGVNPLRASVAGDSSSPLMLGVLRKPKNELTEDPVELQRKIAQDAKVIRRRLQNRTRKINCDGMMDEILAASL